MPPLKAPPKPAAKADKPAPLAGPIVVPSSFTNMASDGLPEGETDQEVKMEFLKWLFVAPPGFGKTTFFSLFPNCLNLACEEGHKFVKGFKLIIDAWEGNEVGEDSDGNLHMSFTEAVKRIESSTRFSFAMIDTVDAVNKMCIDHHVGKAKQQHISELGDYGKGYDLAQNLPMRREMSKILKSGRGLGLVTHQKIATQQFKKGPASKKETTLPNGIYEMLFPQMDIIIHGEFGGVRAGQKHRDRIIKSEGSEDILAKNRGGVLPPAWICPADLEESAALTQSFFKGTAEDRASAIEAAHKEYQKFYED